jgi:hypothetical protein
MTYRMQITIDGETYVLLRDVAHQHPPAVHQAMGTASEVELQCGLDRCNVDDWYDAHGRHLGPDVNGLEMFR